MLITKLLMGTIYLFCLQDIDPKFDKNFCMEYMVVCVERNVDIEDCADFYEQ
jgi:hypothetical protein